jgi:hypothetical protein
VLAVSGGDAAVSERHARPLGLWTGLATELSRALDAQSNLVDREVELARRGAGFLLAYAPDEP